MFVMKMERSGQFYFVLKAWNGEIIARSEAYATKQACAVGIDSVRRVAPGASVSDETGTY